MGCIRGYIRRADVTVVLKDESLIQDLAKALVHSAEATEDPVEDVADWLGDTIEDEP